MIKKNNLHKVIKFTEKPTKKIAKKFINNDTIIIGTQVFLYPILNSIEIQYKIMLYIAHFCDKAYQTSKTNEKTNEVNFETSFFSKIPANSIDYAVMEYEKNIFYFNLKINGAMLDHGMQYLKFIKIRLKIKILLKLILRIIL